MGYLNLTCWICILYGMFITLRFLHGFIRRVFSPLIPRNLLH